MNGSLKVLKFDSDGNFIKEWGEKGKASNQFSPRIEDIDTDSNNNVYVIDYGKKPKILKFDSDGNFIFSLAGGKGEGIGELKRPWGMRCRFRRQYLCSREIKLSYIKIFSFWPIYYIMG